VIIFAVTTMEERMATVRSRKSDAEGCDRAKRVLEPWADALPPGGLEEAETLPKDPRWFWNSIAADAVGYSCGRIGSARDERPHRHRSSEVKLCHDVARRCAEILEDCLVPFGDEGDHPWFPFAAPAILDEAIPGRLTFDVLQRACGGALYPDLAPSFQPLRKIIEEVAGQGREKEELSAYSELVAYLEKHRELRLPTYIRPREDCSGDNPASVVPHFFVALTKNGSLVGVAGLTVWT
jgi:hypothetical protein